MNKKPYIICHMMETLDGKIASGVDGVEIIMQYFDIYTEIERLFDSKVWMCGRKTMVTFAESVGTVLPKFDDTNLDKDFMVKSESGRYMITIDVSGVLRWKKNVITLSGQKYLFSLIIIVNSGTPKNYLSYLKEKNISYIFADNPINFSTTLSKIGKLFSIDQILLEGGGSLNGSLISAGVVDELSVLLLPKIFARKKAPSLADADNDSLEIYNFTPTHCEKLDRGVFWLRYKKS